MKNFISSFSLFSAIFFILSNSCFAAHKYYWKPAGSSRSFNTAGNWRVDSCTGSASANVPGSTDTILFSNCSNKECHINANASVASVFSLGTYNDTLYQDNGYTFTFEQASLKGGVFMGGNSAISCTKEILIDGMAFKSTSDVFTITGDFTYKTGGFTHNNGKLVFNKGASSNTVISSTSNSVTLSLYKAEFGAPSHPTTFVVRNIDMQVNNELSITGDSSLLLNSNTSSIIQAKGDVKSSNTNSTGGGSCTININGTGSQTWSDVSGSDATGKFPNVKVNKSGGTLSLSGTIAMGGSTELNYVAGTLSAGTSSTTTM